MELEYRTTSLPGSSHHLRGAAAAMGLWLLLCCPAMVSAQQVSPLAPKKIDAVRAVSATERGTGAKTVRQLIVKYRDETAQTFAARADSRAAKSLSSEKVLAYHRPMSGMAHVYRLPEPMTEAEARSFAAELRRFSPSIEYAEPDSLIRPLATPNDPFFITRQWNYLAPAPASQLLGGANLPTAWDVSVGTGVVVAVIDTGYLPHPDLLGNSIAGYDFVSDTFVSNDGDGRDTDPTDPGDWIPAAYCSPTSEQERSSWHGTHVAGLVAAVTNNGIGVAGVAGGARVLHVRVLGRCGGLTSDIADAIRWASGAQASVTGLTWSQLGVPNNLTPARVINLSLGIADACGPTYQEAVNAASSQGALIVAATGNDGGTSISSPASCQGVVAVTAHTFQGDRADYADVGAGTAISAPGGGACTTSDSDTFSCLTRGAAFERSIWSTHNTGVTTASTHAYIGWEGSSLAAPHVAGVAALLISAYPAITARQARGSMMRAARSFPSGTYCAAFTDGRCGAGMLDGAASLSLAAVALSTGPQPLVSAALPASRSVAVGATATAFATVINTGTATAYGCEIAPAASLSANFWFQPTDPVTNAPVGIRNRPVDIPAGAAQAFVIGFTPTATFAPTDVALRFDCINAPPAAVNSGLNTLLLSATATPGPDIVALSATSPNDGVARIPGATGTGVFAVASVNVGTSGNITVSADTAGVTLPVAVSLCQTNPSTGVCLAPPAPTVSATINAGATPTFAVFVAGSGIVAFDPARNRVTVRFRETATNAVRGATSVAIRTQ